MPTHSELDRYASTLLDLGQSPADVTHALLGAGWDADTVIAAVAAAHARHVPHQSLFSSPFFPSGLQVIPALRDLASQYPRFRFHAVEALAYWTVWTVIAWPLSTLSLQLLDLNLGAIDASDLDETALPNITPHHSGLVFFLWLIYGLGFGILLPAYWAYKTSHNQLVKLPVVWELAARFSGFDEEPEETPSTEDLVAQLTQAPTPTGVGAPLVNEVRPGPTVNQNPVWHEPDKLG